MSAPVMNTTSVPLIYLSGSSCSLSLSLSLSSLFAGQSKHRALRQHKSSYLFIEGTFLLGDKEQEPTEQRGNETAERKGEKLQWGASGGGKKSIEAAIRGHTDSPITGYSYH